MPLPAILGALGRALGGEAAAGAASAGRGADIFRRLAENAGTRGDAGAQKDFLEKEKGKLEEQGKLRDKADQVQQTMRKLNFGFDLFGKTIGFVSGALRSVVELPGRAIAAPINAFTEAIQLFNSPVLIAVDSIKQFRNAIGAVGQSVSEFVKLANPVFVQQFNIAMEDFTASIGRILVPVLEASTVFVRGFADVIFSLSGPLNRLTQSAVQPFIKFVTNAVDIIAPYISQIGTAIENLIKIITPFVDLLRSLGEFGLRFFIKGLNDLNEMFGPVIDFIWELIEAFATFAAALSRVIDRLSTERYGEIGRSGLHGASKGAAVRPAEFQTLEDYGRKAQQAAFSLGTAATSPEVRTAEATEKLYTFASEVLYQTIKGIWDTIKGTGEAVANTADEIGRRARELGTDLDRERKRLGRKFESFTGLELPEW